MSKKQKVPLAAAPGGGLGGLAAALQATGLAASTPAPTPTVRSPAADGAAAPSGAGGLRGKVVIRREKKGRGGKTATVLEGAPIAAADRAALAKRLRKAMGCGAREEGQTVVVQGDQREAVKAWLEKEGATVVVGN
jgi:translation initiation factor 1